MFHQAEEGRVRHERLGDTCKALIQQVTAGGAYRFPSL